MTSLLSYPVTELIPESPKRTRHSRAFHWRGAIGGCIFLPAFVILSLGQGIVPEGSLLDWVADSLGWLFFVLYATCRIWATLYVGGQKDQVMQTEGIYSLTRNPLYLGSTFLAFSACMFFQSVLLLLLTFLVLAFYLFWVIRSEEAYLRERFGSAFDDYVKRTPRFLPRFTHYRTPRQLTVNVSAMRREAGRLWGAACIPIAGALLETVRNNPHWPHLFRLL